MRKSTNALSVIHGGGSPESLPDDLVGAVQRYVDSIVAPLREKILVQQVEIEALKAREPQPGRDGLPGAPGVPGRDGAPGAPGKDGLGFDDLQLEFDGERRATFKLCNDGRVKILPTVVLPSMIYRGVYRPETLYERADTVSFGGSIWYAKTDTFEKPGNGCKDWQLACKHGRDGRDGKNGERGERGLPGPPGKDLRHLG